MSNAITSALQAIAATPTQAAPAAKTASPSLNAAPAQTKAAPKDTVQISTAGQTALQELQETQVQTAKEAVGGDRQAQRLLARETAVNKA